jgi:resuscitation-promoting factor RpfB
VSLVWELCLLAGLVLVGAAGCQPTSKRVIILVDGQRRQVETQAATVSEVLREQKIELGESDRVDPPGYTPIDRTATIHIMRVEIKTDKTTEPIEFSRQLLRDDSLPEGKMQVVRLGANGEAEITFQITLEDGKEVSRREVGRTTLQPPSDEILEVGTQNSLPPVRFNGALAYLAHGNAWVMRDTSGNKRPLTFEGDLDGRVFDLSPDGRYLIFTRSGAAATGGPLQLNSLWLADTLVLGEKPRRIPLDNLLYAQWALDGSNQIAYSTGEKTEGAPGWKARNDLYIASLDGIATTLPITAPLLTPLPASQGESGKLTLSGRQIISPSVPAPYAWWGANWAWSPDGQVFAYGFANQIGLVNVSNGTRRAVKTFAYYDTRANWVWTPQIAWSPDSRYVMATVHAPSEGAGPIEDSPTFDLWAFARDNSVNLAFVRASGMWSSPTWSPPDANSQSRIAYGVALNTADSERSPYALYVMDRDGSNRARIFPQGNENGLQAVQVAWSPDDSQLAAVRDGDLWLYDFGRAAWSQLTANGDTRLPRWK